MNGGNGENSWGVSFSLISWFEEALSAQFGLVFVGRHDDIVFEVKRTSFGDAVTILCINKYAASLEVVMRAIKEFPDVDIIFFGGNWNKATRDAEEFCFERKISLCNTKTIFKALKHERYWEV